MSESPADGLRQSQISPRFIGQPTVFYSRGVAQEEHCNNTRQPRHIASTMKGNDQGYIGQLHLLCKYEVSQSKNSFVYRLFASTFPSPSRPLPLNHSTHFSHLPSSILPLP